MTKMYQVIVHDPNGATANLLFQNNIPHINTVADVIRKKQGWDCLADHITDLQVALVVGQNIIKGVCIITVCQEQVYGEEPLVPQIVYDQAAQKVKDRLEREVLECMLGYMDLKHAPRHAVYACFVPYDTESEYQEMQIQAKMFPDAIVSATYRRFDGQNGVQIEIVQPVLLDGPEPEARMHPKIALIRLVDYMKKATWLHDNYGWREVN